MYSIVSEARQIILENAYNPILLESWEANLDFQFIWILMLLQYLSVQVYQRGKMVCQMCFAMHVERLEGWNLIFVNKFA